MADTVKTNVMRILEKEGVPHHVHFYDPDQGIDGLSVARQLGQDPQAVFKTLVTQGKSGAYFVFVVPVEAELDLKKAARSVDEKAVAMIPVKDINKVTGYVRGGCSPFGMKKLYTTRIDESAILQEKIFVSAGRIGQQIEIAPDDIISVVGAEYADITA